MNGFEEFPCPFVEVDEGVEGYALRDGINNVKEDTHSSLENTTQLQDPTGTQEIMLSGWK